MANKLSILAEREVDLIDIKRIDTVFTEGTLIYIADENIFISQRIRASMYATLNEQRAPVIGAIKESGHVLRHE